MRIHRLSITAFGPYPGTETIDFEPLNDAGIFLLTGPTGAGKSTVFEALLFALYGQTSLPENAKGLRSDFADPAHRPVVELEFTVGEHRYRVERSPVWNRPSRRAKSGWVRQEAQVSLSRRPAEAAPGSSWEVLSVRNDEAGERLNALLGLTRQQFAQVVLLPQGRFAQFLAATSAERETLLKKLFPTALYEDVTEILRERAQEARSAVARTREALDREEQELEETVRTLGLALGPDPADESTTEDPESPASGLTGRAETVRTALDARRQAQQKDRDRAERAREEAEAALRDAERLAEQWRRHRELRDRRETLRAGDAEREARARALERAEAAEPVLRALTEAERVRTERDAARTQAEQLRARAATTLALHPWTREPAPEERRREDAWWAAEEQDEAITTMAYRDLLESRAEDLRRARESLEELAAARSRRAELSRGLEDLERRREEIDLRLARLGQTQEETREAIGALRERAERLPELEREQERAETVLRSTELLARTMAERARQAAESAAAQQERTRAIDAYERLQAARLDHAATVLAEELYEGAPCPVCGATEHPAPASPAPAGFAATDPATSTPSEAAEVSGQALRAAREAQTRAAERAEQALRVLAATDARIEHLEADGALRDRDRAGELAARARQGADAARQARDRAEEQSQALEARAEEIRREEARRHALAEERAGLAARDQDAQRIEQELAETAAGLPEAEELARRAQVLARLAEDARGLEHARAAGTTAQARLDAALQAVEGALGASPFPTGEQARQSGLDAPALTALRKAVRHDAEQVARLDEAWNDAWHREFLERHERGEAAEPQEGDLAELAQRVRDRRAEHEERLGAAERTTVALQEVARRLARIRDLESGARGELDRQRLLGDLADVAAGNGSENLLRMSLTTYVLAAQLEEIAQAASVRLREMTGGRYSLLHTDAAARHGRHSGLGLEVHDAWSSVTRSTSTLSGGESFMASLCLALGLADVVQARAGGITIDTLFVDEGFGTLDEATLEDVMDAIDGLRENGRVIGLISHVADMRARIPAQIRVARTPAGSRIQTSLETAP